MSSRDEELIDYEDENDITNGAPATAQNGAAASSDAVAAPAGGADGDKDKKNYTGIHSTGFRSVETMAYSPNGVVNICGSSLGTSC
jgi:ATP-dependent RNA helicase UAP56/SUB2